MTQEDRNLLLKDLSARLPYGVKVYDTRGNFNSSCQRLVHINGPMSEAFVVNGLMCRTAPITDLKPYLFPLSSMTEEQRNEYSKTLLFLKKFTFSTTPESYDWLNANHFDYRGLIEKGLAIDATCKNIY